MKPHPLNRNFAWEPTTGPFRRLSAQQARDYDERGYLVLEQALSREDVLVLTEEADRFELESSARPSPDEIMFADGGRTSFSLRLATRSRRVRAICFTPLIQDLIFDLVGPNVWLSYDHSIYKMPNGDLPFFWHQDNAYPFIEPQQRRLTIWIALTEMTLENGCIWVHPGGHLAGTLEHENSHDGWTCYEEAPKEAIPILVPAGGLLVHPGVLPHYSGPNRTNVVRKAFSFEFVPDEAYAIQLIDGETRHVPFASGIRVLREGQSVSSSP